VDTIIEGTHRNAHSRYHNSIYFSKWHFLSERYYILFAHYLFFM